MQTHVSENPAECQAAKDIHPGSRNYVDIYGQAGLLSAKTILAHGVHLSDEEVDVIHRSRTSISHCPNSNCSLRSGLCDARRLMDRGIHVGLGTDVSGGYSPSLMNAMRFAMTVSNVLSMSGKPEEARPLNFRHVFYMATLGGAKALGLDDKIGNFEPGKRFDALVVDLADTLDLWPGETADDRLSKWVHLGDDRTIRRVYVDGIEVKASASETLQQIRRTVVQ